MPCVDGHSCEQPKRNCEYGLCRQAVRSRCAKVHSRMSLTGCFSFSFDVLEVCRVEGDGLGNSKVHHLADLSFEWGTGQVPNPIRRRRMTSFSGPACRRNGSLEVGARWEP